MSRIRPNLEFNLRFSPAVDCALAAVRLSLRNGVGMETNRARIVRRLESEGWRLTRSSGPHDVFDHPDRAGVVVVPRHRELSIGVARQIHRVAGWSVK